MTTEFGLPKLREIRGHIEALRDRRDWLMAKRAATGVGCVGDREDVEMRAIDWALPVLEAAWDSVARLRREIVDPAENRVRSIEGRERALAEAARR